MVLLSLTSSLFWGVFKNNFNGIALADGKTIAAHIAFCVVDLKLFRMFIDCLKRTLFPAFPALNALIRNPNARKRNLRTPKTETCAQQFMRAVFHFKVKIKHFPPGSANTESGHGGISFNVLYAEHKHFIVSGFFFECFKRNLSHIAGGPDGIPDPVETGSVPILLHLPKAHSFYSSSYHVHLI